MFADMLDMIDPFRIPLQFFKKTTERATEQRENYAAKLESATGDGVFKYVLLMNVSALEGYVAQTRIQAAQSFRLSQIVAVVGFLLIATGVAAGIYLSVTRQRVLDMAYIASGAGILTEFVSGVFFYLYNRTLHQINRFHDKLVAMEQTSMSLLASSQIKDESKRDDATLTLARELLSVAAVKSCDGDA